MKRLVWLLLILTACTHPVVPGSGPVNPFIPPVSGDVPHKHMTGFIKPSSFGLVANAPFKNADEVAEIPYSFSWEAAGFDVPTRDQGNCGSCWAFASVATVDYSAQIYGDHKVVLSEQQVVGYDSEFQGCSGGDFAGSYIQTNGLALDSACPYTASNSGCPSGWKTAEHIKSWANVGVAGRSPTQAEIQLAILEYGPVAVDVAATNSWDSYAGGVKSDCHGTAINHMVTIVGWDGSKGVWLVRNQWGAAWGESIPGSSSGGYAELPYGCDAIATDVAYVEYQ